MIYICFSERCSYIRLTVASRESPVCLQPCSSCSSYNTRYVQCSVYRKLLDYAGQEEPEPFRWPHRRGEASHFQLPPFVRWEYHRNTLRRDLSVRLQTSIHEVDGKTRGKGKEERTKTQDIKDEEKAKSKETSGILATRRLKNYIQVIC